LGSLRRQDCNRAEIETIRAGLRQTHPNPFEDHRQLRTVPLQDELVGAARSALLLLLGAAVFVLLIACANVGNLLLARASVRRKEIGVRVALGADQARVLRQLTVEGLILAALGSAAGLLFARSGLAAIIQIDPHAIPRLAETTIDIRALVAVLAACVLMALAFGLAPAFTVWRMPAQDALRGGDRAVSPDLASVRTRKLLVASEVALALLLLIGAGLMVKSAWRMQAYPAGFEPERVLTAKIEFAGPAYSEPWRSLRFADALLDRLGTESGVDAVSISTHGYMLSPGLMIEGDPVPTPEQLGSKPPIMINATSAGLKQIMGFRMSRGRWFTDDEAAAVLNESLARRELGGRDPIGRRIRISDNGSLLTIVGVVEDVKYSQLDAPAEPEVYVPYRRVDDGLFGFTALILTASDPLALALSVRRAVADIDKTQAPDDLMTLDQRLADSIAPRRLNTFLFSAFAASALLLAIVGIYGVMAYVVTQHLHEIGVRLALGAQRIAVVWMIIRQGMNVTSIGIIAGVTGAVVLTRLMNSVLYEVQPTDPLTFASATVALAVTAFVACFLPALKGAFVDPAITLRDE
jgi:putative ABC transport system permease protein